MFSSFLTFPLSPSVPSGRLMFVMRRTGIVREEGLRHRRENLSKWDQLEGPTCTNASLGGNAQLFASILPIRPQNVYVLTLYLSPDW